MYLEDAYGDLKLSKETSKQCNFAITGGNMNGYYRLKKKRFYGSSDISIVYREKKDGTLNYETPRG